MKKQILLLCSIVASGWAEPGTLTLEEALALARKNSPELQAARLHARAAEEAVAAAGRRANPQLEFEAEGVGGDLDGFDDTEYTIGLSQTFLRRNKRRSEREVASQMISLASHAGGEKELALLAEVRLAFIDVLALQEIGNVREEQEQLGRAFVKVAQMRYQAGGASQIDLIQAELQLEEIMLAQTCCFGDLEAARIHLASLIGIPEQELGKPVYDYYALDSVEAASLAESHPSLQHMDARIRSARARAGLARAADEVDVTLGAGYRYEAGPDTGSFVFGASMPLSFVRPGRVREASILLEADALEAERDELRRELQRGFSTIRALYKGAKLEADLTRDKLIPKAQEAYDLSKAGYDAGRYSWVELIASQQHLAEIRVRYIEALQDAHLARAEMHRFMKQEM